ncbi:MAG: amidase [Rhodospirillales bacterium]|nr:amidase [Rhodospirillales bacterium]
MSKPSEGAPGRDDPVGAFVPHSPPPVPGRAGGPLSGLTFAAKDLFDLKGYTSGCGSPDWLRTHGPAEQTSPLIEALLAAGADLVGKTVCDELFYSFTGANAHYGTPKNVRAPDRLPGGSSSGSVAAVAAGLCDFALGSDTGGSVRIPASFCGLYGLRPTHGRVDLSHAQAMAPSFDCAGWFADDASLFRKIGGFLLDGNGVAHAVEKVLIGTFAFNHADDEVSAPLEEFIGAAKRDFPALENLDRLPDNLDMDEARETFRVIQAFEVWQTFGAWVEEVDPDLGPGIRDRVHGAKSVGREERDAADGYRAEVRNVLEGLLTPGTVLCLPTAASLPARVDAGPEELEYFRKKTMSLIALAGLAGLPQVTIPAAHSGGVPVGLSFIGWRGGDEALLEMAAQLGPRCRAG